MVSEKKWIPCKERMPEEREWIGTKKFGTTKSEPVLVTLTGKDLKGNPYSYVKESSFQNGKLLDMDTWHGKFEATAWMPLP